MKNYKVVFAPSFKEISARQGASLLDIARDAGVYIDSHCNGKGTCGKCRIRVVEGPVTPFTAEESEFIKEADRDLGFRLACMTRISGDVTILVPEENILASEATKKAFSKRSDVVNPAVKTYALDLTDGGDVAGLLAKEGLGDLVLDRYAMSDVNEGKMTAVTWMDKEVITVRPGWNEPCLGLALDVGTTTVALYVCDLKNGDVIASGSFTNPQVLFGADIMSRISYSTHHPVSGVIKMQKELAHSVNALINQMAADMEFLPSQIIDMTMVGNTVMHHIFLGIAPDHLGLWPFTPSVRESRDVKARELGIRINPSAYVHVLPVEAGFVGADNVGVLISEEPYNHDELSLIIDLGTNGEIVLGNRKGILSCSCATGPALEGAHIASGMRAAAGAIEKVLIDPATGDVDYKVVGGDLKPVGICGSGIIDAVAHLFKAGFIGENGTFSEDMNVPRLRKGHGGAMEFVLAWKNETATGSDIVLTQRDIRQIQLAKAALHGGCRVLMGRLGVNTINRMVIAGAFGMHIDKENALAIGLFPWCAPENIFTVGNAAGHGAYLALVNREKRKEADAVAGTVTHVELALEDAFQREFMKALAIPYASG